MTDARKPWQTSHHYAYGAVATLGTFAAVAAIGWLMTTAAWAGWAPEMAEVSGPLLNVLGVLFGLTLAFLANDTWTAHDRARTTILREADAVRGLDILAESAPEATRQVLRKAVRDYVSTAVGEWPALARYDISPAASAASDQLLRAFSSISPNDTRHAVLQQTMLRYVVQIREHRDVRVGLSRTHVNPLKWFGMALLGFLTIVSIAVVHATEPVAALIAMGLFGLASAPTATIVLIHGNPFQPPSAVSTARLAAALAGR
jgi:hypothetical protein